MANLSVSEHVIKLCEPAITDKGLELVDVEYVKEGPHWYLRFYIDKEGGVDLDDCADISHVVGEILDQTDVIAGTYMLEVSSPGLERPLKKDEDYIKFKEKLVSLHTKKAIQGFTEFTGYLQGLENGQVILEYEGEKVEIPKELIEKAHLALDF